MTNSPDAHARALADHAAGGDLAQLHANLDAAQTNIQVWLSTYRAALDATPEPVDDGPLLTVRDAAARLQVSKGVVYELVASGRLPKVENVFGDAIRIRPADLAALIQTETT